MLKSKIDWCDSTFNPVTGCLHGCEYCYARSIAQRFGGFTELEDTDLDYEKILGNDVVEIDKPLKYLNVNGKVRKSAYPFFFKPTFYRYKLDEPRKWKKGRNIFVCSMADLFGDWVPDSWIEEVFKACEKAPQHNYLFLTKNPKRYGEYVVPLRKNMWYGVSITKESDMDICGDVFFDTAYTFASIEPILEGMNPSNHKGLFRVMNWIIICAETGRRKNKIIPKRKWIEDIVNECRK